jgi:hypothetical protein
VPIDYPCISRGRNPRLGEIRRDIEIMLGGYGKE